MSALDWNVDTIAHVIEIAVAPVFLLAGISGLLVVLTNRLGRAIDRSRALQAVESEAITDESRHLLKREMGVLMRRIQFANAAICLAVASAILVCLVVIALFFGSLLQVSLSAVLATLFIVCMTLLGLAFSVFFLEVLLSIRILRYRVMHLTNGDNGDDS